MILTFVFSVGFREGIASEEGTDEAIKHAVQAPQAERNWRLEYKDDVNDGGLL